VTAQRLTPEIIVDVENVNDPQISPDGKRVAFVRARGHRLDKCLPSEIWLVEADGQEPARRFTAGPRCDDHPRWSPDGRWLAFLSDREVEDEPRLHVMPSEFGEGRQVGDLGGSVSELRWRPDSQAIGFLRKDVPPPEEKARTEELRDDAIVTDRDERFTRLWLVTLPDDAARQVSPPDLHVWDFDFSPDGREAILVRTSDPSLDEQMRQCDLVVLDVESGATRTLCPTRGAVHTPRWSPDGRWIAFRAGDGEEYIGGGVRVCPAHGGPSRLLLEDYGGDASWLAWLPDGRLAVAAFTDLDTSILAVSPGGGSPEQLLAEERFVIGPSPMVTSFDRSGRRFATTGENAQRPREVFVGEVGAAPRRRTSIQDRVAGLEHGEVRRLTWPADDGQQISSLLYLPVGYATGQRAPLIVQVHGGPASHYTDGFRAGSLSWGPLLAANGYAVLLANPRGSGGRGRAFARANFRDWGGGDYRDLLAGVDHVVALGIADPERLGMAGWSYGGYMTAWTITQTQRFKAAVIGAAITNMLSFQGTTDIARGFIPLHYVGEDPYHHPDFWRERSPLEHIVNARTPSLILCGEEDARVPIGQSWELYRALRSLGIATQFVRYPREEHGPHERTHQIDVQRRALAWFDRFL